MSTLENNTAELQQILNAVNELPSGGSGGGNLNTCTIHVSTESASQGGGCIAVTQWTEGDVVPSVYMWFVGTPSTIENVVCGSVITARDMAGCVSAAFVSDNMTIFEVDGYLLNRPGEFVAITAPTESNAVGEIRFRQ